MKKTWVQSLARSFLPKWKFLNKSTSVGGLRHHMHAPIHAHKENYALAAIEQENHNFSLLLDSFALRFLQPPTPPPPQIEYTND